MRGAPVVDPESTLRSTAKSMAVSRAGAAIVHGANGATNIVTDRDLVRALADGADPDTVWAADVASTHLVAVASDAIVADALRQMSQEGIRHVPVRSGGDVVGLVTAEDLLDVLERGLLGLTPS